MSDDTEQRPESLLPYQEWTEAAMRQVMVRALAHVGAEGLPGSHHFYLTFKTHGDGVDIPEFLKEQYPDEMTIIIQHQYWALKVRDDYFEVTLTFKKLPAPLHIPFAALTAFFDPGVQFGLQFRGDGEGKASIAPVVVPAPMAESPETSADDAPDPVVVSDKPAAGEVVSLDSFRKK